MLKFPELEKYNNRNTELTPNFIDYSSMKKLKDFSSNIDEFIHLGNNILYCCYLTIKENNIHKNDKKAFEKLFSMNIISNIIIHDFSKANNYDIINNIKVKNIFNNQLYYFKNNEQIDIFPNTFISNLHSKFPSLKTLCYSIHSSKNLHKIPSNLIVIENTNSKLVNFSVDIEEKQNIKIQCNLFKNLNYISFNFSCPMNNIINSFPIFNSNCQTIFKSLKTFFFDFY